MAKIEAWVSTDDKDYPYPQVAIATESLLKTIRVLDFIAKPKHFNLSYCNLIKFERVPSDGSKCRIRVEYPPDNPMDEIFVWQVIGTIGNRTVNVISKYVFHTHENNRSGSGEWLVNGKEAYLREDLGGLSEDDVWQDIGAYKKYFEGERHDYYLSINKK